MARALRKDDIFQAIAHPMRRDILRRLKNGECPASELAKPFGVSAPAISEHLRVLREVGLVSEHRAGRQRIYRLEPEPLKEVYDWMSAFEEYWADKLRSLGDYLEETYGKKNKKD